MRASRIIGPQLDEEKSSIETPTGVSAEEYFWVLDCFWLQCNVYVMFMHLADAFIQSDLQMKI